MQQTAGAKSKASGAGRHVWIRRVGAGSAILVVSMGGLLWLLRKPIAESALDVWCADRDLTCDARFTRIGMDGATLTGVRIVAGEAVPAAADEIHAQISWPKLFSPKIERISINGLTMRGTLDPSGLKFYGLETLASGGGDSGTLEAPVIDIRDARIHLGTPFGNAAATLNVNGQMPRQASLSLVIDPARLALGDTSLVLSEAQLMARIDGGQVTGELRLGADQAATSQARLSGLSLAAEAAFPFGVDGAASFEWSGRLSEAQMPEAGLKGVRTRGRAEFTTLPQMNPASLLEALTDVVAEASLEEADAGDWSSGSVSLGADLEGREGEILGPLTLEAATIAGPVGQASELRLAGDMRRDKTGKAVFAGGVQLNGAALEKDMLRPVLSVLELPGEFAAHGVALSSALEAAAEDFDTAFGLQVVLDDSGFQIEADEVAALAAASGLTLEAKRREGGSWLRWRDGRVLVSGDVRLSGGGAPEVAAHISDGAVSADGIALADSWMELSPWTEGGRTFAARLNNFDLRQTADSLMLGGMGEISFSGALAGVAMRQTKISGGLSAVRDQDGLRVQSEGAPCLAVATEGLSLGETTLSRTRFDVCPVDGRFVRQGRPLGGSAHLGNVKLPLVFSAGEGEAGLERARIDWTLDQGFAFSLAADHLHMPMTLDENTLTVSAEAPRVRVETGNGPIGLQASLGTTEFGGSLIPAKVSAKHFAFDGTTAEEGFAGAVTAEAVRIADLQDDPLYQPVLVDLAGHMDGRQLLISGPARLEASGYRLANTSAELDIFALNGTANIVSERMVFFPDGFQPSQISRRLVGLFTAAQGELSAEADFVIEGGSLQGTADISLFEFGFQTTRLGRVDGITGSVSFSDLMSLTTRPGQQITIASVNPGIPLSGGRIIFSFSEGETLHLDEVTFPFAGGELALAPMQWSLSGGEQSVEMTASRVDLSRLIEVLKLPDTRAEGTVSGSFPIDFTPTSVVIRDARLRADEGGRLSYTGGAINAAAENDPTAAMAFNALRDLEYTVLEVGLSGDLAGQMQADMRLAGRNVRSIPVPGGLTMPSGQAFEFNMGFNLPLAQLIEQGMQSANASNLLEVVSRLDETERQKD